MEKLKFQVLGSAASQGIPEFFCRCRVCTYAREHGGKDVRSRSSYAVGGGVRIDMGPDAYRQSMAAGLLGEELKHLFFTHSHSDHFYIDNLDPLRNRESLHVYGNETVIRQLREYGSADRMIFHELHPGDTARIPELDLSVLALRADHILSETCLLFLLEHGGSRILIGHDTAMFPEETFDLLKGKLCRHLFLDCTWGDMDRANGHMGLPGNLEVLRRLREIGAADDATLLHPAHLGHKYGAMLHDEWRYPEAWDGMTLEF